MSTLPKFFLLVSIAGAVLGVAAMRLALGDDVMFRRLLISLNSAIVSGLCALYLSPPGFTAQLSWASVAASVVLLLATTIFRIYR